MSSALVRQALEFVDPDISITKKKRGGKAKSASAAGRENKQSTKKAKTRSKQENTKSVDTPSGAPQPAPTLAVPQKVLDKLLKLSQPTIDKNTANRITKRVVKGKPLVDKIKVNKQPQKSILFPEG